MLPPVPVIGAVWMEKQRGGRPETGWREAGVAEIRQVILPVRALLPHLDSMLPVPVEWGVDGGRGRVTRAENDENYQK